MGHFRRSSRRATGLPLSGPREVLVPLGTAFSLPPLGEPLGNRLDLDLSRVCTSDASAGPSPSQHYTLRSIEQASSLEGC